MMTKEEMLIAIQKLQGKLVGQAKSNRQFPMLKQLLELGESPLKTLARAKAKREVNLDFLAPFAVGAGGKRRLSAILSNYPGVLIVLEPLKAQIDAVDAQWDRLWDDSAIGIAALELATAEVIMQNLPTNASAHVYVRAQMDLELARMRWAKIETPPLISVIESSCALFAALINSGIDTKELDFAIDLAPKLADQVINELTSAQAITAPLEPPKGLPRVRTQSGPRAEQIVLGIINMKLAESAGETRE